MMKQIKPNTIYGVHAVKAAWLNKSRQILNFYCTAESLAGFEVYVKEAAQMGLTRPRPILKDKGFFRHTFGDDIVHQDLCLEVKPRPALSLGEYLKQGKEKPSDFIVILDQVSDPHNIGAIIRSAVAFGIEAIIVQDKHSPDLTPALVKNAAGAVEFIHYIQLPNIVNAMKEIKEAGYWCYGLDEGGQDDFRGYDYASHSCLIMGSEGKGMRELVQKNCDVIFSLPVTGPVKTLNVSTASAIAFYEISRNKSHF